MFRKIQAKLKSKKGFTLVELLIVIAVLGIIAAIAVPRFAGVLGGVKNSADKRAAELVAKEIEAEFMVETWAFTNGSLTVGPVASKPLEGYDGTLPKTQSGNTQMSATIALANNVYTLTIKESDAQGANTLLTKTINGPVK